MQKEPLAVTTAMRFILNGLIQGLILFDVVTLTSEQHAWLTVTFAGIIEMVLWLITRNEVWAPGGQPTHPPTEALWSEKVAATSVEAAAKLAEQKADYEALFTSPGHAEASTPVAVPMSQETTEALGDNINPGE